MPIFKDALDALPDMAKLRKGAKKGGVNMMPQDNPPAGPIIPASFPDLGLSQQTSSSQPKEQPVGLGQAGQQIQQNRQLGPPPPGTARAWSTAQPTPQEFRGTPASSMMPQRSAMNPVPVTNDPLITSSDSMGSRALGPISDFYRGLGLPLENVIGQAQQDEQLGRSAFRAHEQSDSVNRMLSQLGAAHTLQHQPQAEALQVLQTLGDPGLYQFTQTPQGQALIQHYMLQLMPQGMQPTPTPAPSAIPQKQAEAPQVPYGGLRAALRTGIPALAGAGGWAGAAAMAPETGMGSFLIPAAASALSAFGGNKLMDWLDPQGMTAVGQHPVAALGGAAAGGYGGYKGFGRLGQGAATPLEEVTQAEVSGQTPTITNPAAQVGQARFAGRESGPPMEVGARIPPERQLGFGSTGVQMSADPQVEQAVQQFRSTALPSGGVNPRMPIGTNPVQMPQGPPQTVQFTPEQIQQLLQNAPQQIGPAVTADPALQRLIQQYLQQPAQ